MRRDICPSGIDPGLRGRCWAVPVAAIGAAAALASDTRTSEIYSTDFSFPEYLRGNLDGQNAWTGATGTWALSGSVNSPFTPGSVIGPGVSSGVDPVGGTGQTVATGWGVAISSSFLSISGGFVASSQDGSVVVLNGGHALSNRISTGASVPLNQWNDFVYR